LQPDVFAPAGAGLGQVRADGQRNPVFQRVEEGFSPRCQIAACHRAADRVHYGFALARAFGRQLVPAERLERGYEIEVVHVEGFKGDGGQLAQRDAGDAIQD